MLKNCASSWGSSGSTWSNYYKFLIAHVQFSQHALHIYSFEFAVCQSFVLLFLLDFIELHFHCRMQSRMKISDEKLFHILNDFEFDLDRIIPTANTSATHSV